MLRRLSYCRQLCLRQSTQMVRQWPARKLSQKLTGNSSPSCQSHGLTSQASTSSSVEHTSAYTEQPWTVSPRLCAEGPHRALEEAGSQIKHRLTFLLGVFWNKYPSDSSAWEGCDDQVPTCLPVLLWENCSCVAKHFVYSHKELASMMCSEEGVSLFPPFSSPDNTLRKILLSWESSSLICNKPNLGLSPDRRRMDWVLALPFPSCAQGTSREELLWGPTCSTEDFDR